MPVKVRGLKQLEKQLEQLPTKIARKHLDGAVRKSSYLVRDTAKNSAPGDEGRLHRNIISFKRRSRQYASTFGVGVRTKGNKDSYDNAYYYRFVEFGTRFQSAQPFLRPGLEVNKTRAVGVMARELWRRIKQEAADSYRASRVR